MSLLKPVYSGSDSIVGIAREDTWGTTPTTGSDPNKIIDGEVFMSVKEENIQEELAVAPQADEMNATREIVHVIDSGMLVQGALRMNMGPESIGYFLTALFGTPYSSTQLASSAGTDEIVYQHIWYPGAQSRANWPTPLSIESQFSNVRSKLVQGAIIRRLPIDLPNNAPMTIAPDFLGKKIIWLTSASGTTDDRENTRPAKMTASPVLITETPFHWKHIVQYPTLNVAAAGAANQEEVTALSLEPQFTAVDGLFTGGSGTEIGTYRVDNFQMQGRMTIQFEDDSLWEDFVRAQWFALNVVLKGDLIQGAHYNQLTIDVYSAKANANDLGNKVGNLEYDMGWVAREDPTEGYSCKFTLINTISSYA